ncbi:MAG TPA: sigma 54-interacting transcriptional regulator [Gammaproteobacteria bacterium]|nr:sigma 54-interacting transcriptional regulator [Gammaproteobacteria bacterium]
MDIYSIGGRTPRDADRLYRRQVERAWQAMVERGAPADSQVRDVIRHSWRRSLQWGLEPLSQRPRELDGREELEALREANADLLQATKNTWQVLGDILGQSQSCLLVADATGTLLEVCGRPVLLDLGARDCIAPGYAWSEFSGGTNAVGTALALNAPAEVFSAEHFLSVAKIWSCSAAPVRDTVDGSILGVVDITSFGDNHQAHCLALAVTAAHQIEQTLQSRELARAVQLLHWYQTHAQRWAQRAVILVDRKGRIVTANDAAKTLYANRRDSMPLERGRAFISVDGEPSSTQCAAALPPRTRVADIEAYAGRARAWEGGLIVIEPVREARTPLAASRSPESADAFAHLVGRHASLVELKRRAARVARASAPVLLIGESGSGKESVARGIHLASAAAAGPFVTVNCGALARETACRELFGEERELGGRYAEADAGTLFLDEIGELPPDAQVALLHALQPREPGAAPAPRVRVIAASHRELDAEVASGRFRDDLFYRLRVPCLRVPSLRERLSDLPLLVERFVAELHLRHGLGRKRVAPALLALFETHAWPGNVRELQGVIESMYVLAEGEELGVADLPDGFLQATAAAADDGDALPPGSISRMTRAAIEAELAAHGDNLSEVARRLGISRSTLYRKIKRYGLDVT